MTFKVTGAEKLTDIGKALKQADRSIKNEFTKELRTAGKPAGEAVRTAYADSMPRRGGFAESLRTSKVGVRNRLSGKGAGVRVEVANDHSLRLIEKGRLRHPVFGNRKAKWAEQKVPAGVGNKAFAKQKYRVQARLLLAMGRVARKIEKG